MTAGWVLVVEDNPDDRELITRAWRRLGLAARLETVPDGEVAIARLDESVRAGGGGDGDVGGSRGDGDGGAGGGAGGGIGDGLPMVILLDLKMPRLSGFDVLERLRSGRGAAPPPVVVLTSSGEESDIRRSYALGASGYVVKPVEIDRFLDVVASIGRFWTTTNEPPPDDRGRA